MRINVIKIALMEVKNMCNERTGCEECPFAKNHGKGCLFDSHPEMEEATLPFEWNFEGLGMDASENT